MSKVRLEFFSDGVFAIVCTLLAVGLEMPKFSERSDVLLANLIAMSPSFMSYFLSFALVTLYWIAHHNLVAAVRVSNAAFTWLNSLFLMWFALLPFPTDLMGHYPRNEIAVIFFGLVTLLAALSFTTLRAFVYFRRDLQDPELDRVQLRTSIRNGIVWIAVYACALLVSYASNSITMTMYGLIPFLFLTPLRTRLRDVSVERPNSIPLERS